MAAPRKKDREQIRAARERQGEAIGRYTQTPDDSHTSDTRATHDSRTSDTPMKRREFRIHDHDWQRLQARAADEGTSAGAVIRRLVREYLRAR